MFSTFACLICLIVYGIFPVNFISNWIIAVAPACPVFGLLLTNLITSDKLYLFTTVRPLPA